VSAALDGSLLAPVPRRVDEARAIPVDEHAWCLRLPLAYERTRAVNCFLLADDEGYVLVDCGGSAVPRAWDALEHALGQAGVAPGKIHTLLLSHLHADHASLAATVIARLGCRVLRGRGPDSLYDRLRDPSIPLDVRRRDALVEGVPVHDLELIVDAPLAGDAPAARPHPDGFLGAGDWIRTRSADWRVVPAPGHSPAQIALWDPARRWIIAADLGYPSGTTYLEYGFTPDPYREALDTLERVRALHPVRYFPGHGRPDDDPLARIDAVEAGITGFRAELTALLDRSQPQSAYDLTRRLIGHDPDPDRRGSILSTVLAVLEHEVRGGRAFVACPVADGVRRFVSAG
jgi:glyoxylase-like metal-dependent hydrolase (beta-lactamase superfamily II)